MTIKKIFKKSLSKKGFGATAQLIEIDRGLRTIKKETKRFKKAFTAIGYFFSPGKPDKSISARAIVNEFGAKIKVSKKMRGFFFWKFKIHLKKKIIIIPERPFMKQTFDRSKNAINKRIQIEYNNILQGKLSAKQTLSRIGEWYIAKIKNTISKGNFVNNSEFTKVQKNSSKPLIDSGEMKNSIEHREFMKG